MYSSVYAKTLDNSNESFYALPTQLSCNTSLELRKKGVNQSAVMSYTAQQPRLGQLRKCFDRFFNALGGLWSSIVNFFPKSNGTALQSENEALRTKMDEQRDAFLAALSRHESLLERIFALERDRDSLRKENERIAASGRLLKNEVDYFRQVSENQAARAGECLDSKNAELFKLRERCKGLEAEQKDLKNESSKLMTNRDDLEDLYAVTETEKRDLEASLTTLHETREKETTKWKQIVDQKTLENKVMDSEMSLLLKANEQMQTEREEMEKELEELRAEIDVIKTTPGQDTLENEAQEKISLPLESENDTVKVKLEAEVRKLKEDISKHTVKLGRQKIAITGLQEALSRAKKDSAGLLGAVKGLKEEKKNLKAALSNLETQKNKLETKLKEGQKTVDLQRQSMKAWDACTAQNKIVIDKLHEEKDGLSKAFSQLQCEKHELESRNQELKDEVNVAETRAVSAKAGLDTGYVFVEQMTQKQNEDLKRFLTADGEKRDAQRHKDLLLLRELMEENALLLRRDKEFGRLKMQWENRAKEAEQKSEVYQTHLQNSDTANIASELSPRGP